MRKNNSYRDTVSKDGSLTPHLYSPVSDRIRAYCEKHDDPVGKFVADCMTAQLDVLEREELNSMPKEMLIELLMAKKN